MKKRIVCFGDSNTWGYNGQTGMRFDENTRWTGVLAKELGNDYTIIEEGQNGRTTAWDDPVEGEKNGLKYLIPCLESHAPFDIIIIMLGTNDLKNRFNVSAHEIASTAGRLVKIAQNSEYGRDGMEPKILLASPIHIGAIEKSAFGYMFKTTASAESKELSKFYMQTAETLKCEFFDASLVAQPGEFDFLHMDSASHKALGMAFAKKIRLMV